MKRLQGEHGPIRCTVRVSAENTAAVDALRILARLLVARRNQPAAVALHAPPPLSVPRGVAG
jgi:hypothetical protein